MADFKMTVTILLLLCLVSSGMGMSLVRRDLKGNSAAERFLRALDKRKALVHLLTVISAHFTFTCLERSQDDEQNGVYN